MGKFLAPMRLITFIILARLVTLAALGVLGVFIFGVDPMALTIAGQSLFFFALWLAIAGLVALTLLSLARRFLGDDAARAYLAGALRQGVLLGLYGAGMALAQFLGYLTWWVALLSLAFILLVEFSLRQFTRP